MPELQEMDFAEDFDTVDTSQLPIVDEVMAKKLADKSWASAPAWAARWC